MTLVMADKSAAVWPRSCGLLVELSTVIVLVSTGVLSEVMQTH